MTKRLDEDAFRSSETAYDKAIRKMEEREAKILSSSALQQAASVTEQIRIQQAPFIQALQPFKDIMQPYQNLIKQNSLGLATTTASLREEEKLDILKNEYHIPMEKSIREDVKVMCNLSEGIEERGIIKGRTELLKQLVQKKLAKGQSMEVIAEDLVEDVEVIRTIVDEIQTEK